MNEKDEKNAKDEIDEINENEMDEMIKWTKWMWNECEMNMKSIWRNEWKWNGWND